MDRIWAPWRMEYIAAPKPDGCLFCEAAEAGVGRDHLVLVKNELLLIMLNRYPYVGGHLMVVPLRHTNELNDLGDAELLALMRGVRQARSALRRAVAPEGFNIGMNMGKAAGAGVEAHLHIHIVPRWNGDTNFMHPIGDVRVISEGLMENYDRLRTAIEIEGRE